MVSTRRLVIHGILRAHQTGYSTDLDRRLKSRQIGILDVTLRDICVEVEAAVVMRLEAILQRVSEETARTICKPPCQFREY